MTASSLGRAREAFERKTWNEAFAAFGEAATEAALDPEDLFRLAVAAHLLGKSEESKDILAQGYRESLRLGEAARAARFAFWVGHALMFEGRESESSGWLARGRQLVAGKDECAEHGYLLIPEGVERLMAGDPEAASRAFDRAHQIGMRCGDPNLVAMSCHGRGRALVRRGLVAEGMAVLDEVIVALSSGEVSPIVVGDVYCGVLEACHEVFDLRRAREWTGALSRWCDGQDDLVPHRGPCLVYRAEVMQFHGAWADALDEAKRACALLAEPTNPEGPADAHYRIAELHRLRGDYAEAEEAYRQASRLGRHPDPGLALLRLATGNAAAARAALERALAEETQLARRALLLEAVLRVRIQSGDINTAREAASELNAVAQTLDAPALKAFAATSTGAILLAEGNAREALSSLRAAWAQWQRLDAPYDAARVRRAMAEAYTALGDEESAAMELDAARWVFQQLGAAPDLAALDGEVATKAPGGLTSRELDVLGLLAAGLTNREIGAALVISEHTVARHVQNMFARLGFSSRAALVAFAVEHRLVATRTQN